jgi:hypothetical protein
MGGTAPRHRRGELTTEASLALYCAWRPRGDQVPQRANRCSLSGSESHKTKVMALRLHDKLAGPVRADAVEEPVKNVAEEVKLE